MFRLATVNTAGKMRRIWSKFKDHTEREVEENLIVRRKSTKIRMLTQTEHLGLKLLTQTENTELKGLDPAEHPGFIVFSHKPKPKSWCIGPLGRPPPIIPVTVIGEPKVGKTSITRHFRKLKFTSKYSPTFGVERSEIEVLTPDDICDPKVVFRFLDTNDVIIDQDIATNIKDRVDSIMASLSRFVLIVYDITDHSSFEAARDWVFVVRNMLLMGSMIILVGNKADQEKKREVHRSAGEVLALQNDMFFLETSAKRGDNLDHLLQYILDV